MSSTPFPKPWLKFYGSVPESIEYPRITLYEKLAQSAQKYPNRIAWEFMGTKYTYATFLKEIDMFANGLAALGFQKGDVITISMPTCPNGIIPIYAVNKLGGVCSMIHPLSPAPQIREFLKISQSRFILTLNAFYKVVNDALSSGDTNVEKIILAKLQDYLNPIMSAGFWVKKGRKLSPIPPDVRVVWYADLLKGRIANYRDTPKVSMDADDTAIILYSGGTSGVPKGILLSNLNMISEGMMVAAWGNLTQEDKILAILPIFHGFGLGVCVNGAFMGGATSILVPTFTPEEVAKLVNKRRPTFLVGVPTLYEALSNNPKFQQSDLSCLKACFAGADTLPRPTKEKFEAVVRGAKGNVKLLEGYGLTEAVTAIMATPLNEYREGSVGVPFPDMLAKICTPDTTTDLPIGNEGELCISGPAVMMGYLNNPEETVKTIRKHADGRIWLHTGDIGRQDADGFFYFILRKKRMLKVSGINVYPKPVEETILQHPAVASVCVIGIPDQKQISRVKAFIVRKPTGRTKAEDTLKQEIINFCQARLLKYECPREIEFRDALPLTLVGKVAFNELEKEELAKLKAAHQYPFE